MVSVDKAVIAKYVVDGKKFEILVDSEKALAYKTGQPYSLENILAVNHIFKDSKKGEQASSSELKNAFKTEDLLVIAEKIIKHGEIQLTTEQRKRMTEEKRKQVITMITRNAINPQSGLPHPPQRIEAAMDEARVKIDPFKKAEEQIADILSEIKVIIPIRFEKKMIACKFPAMYAARAVGTVKHIAEIKKEVWLNDGSWAVEVEIPAGTIQEFIDTVNRESHGNVEVKILDVKK